MSKTLELKLCEKQRYTNGVILGLKELENIGISDLMTLYVERNYNHIVYRIMKSKDDNLTGKFLRLEGIDKFREKLFGDCEGEIKLSKLEKYILRTISAYNVVPKAMVNSYNIGYDFKEPSRDFLYKTSIDGLNYRKLLDFDKSDLLLGIGLGGLYVFPTNEDYAKEVEWENKNYK